jgi:hypothetical protein
MKLNDILLEVWDNQKIEKFKEETIKTFPNIKLKPDTFNKFGYPVFILDGNEIELANLRKMVKVKKIDTILKWFIDNGNIKDVKPSKTTDSKYFTRNGYKVRLSDHNNPYKEFDGVDFPVTWHSDVENVIKHILSNT